MSIQLSIIDEIAQSNQATNKGIQKAAISANNQTPNWTDNAYKYVYHYLQLKPSGHQFMLEDIRIHAEASGILPHPPSKRAWGHVVLQAAKNNLIKRQGIAPVRNVKAHKALATVWTKI